MKRYFDHIKTKSPHERRQHAMQVACGASVLIALIWLTSLGFQAQRNAPQTVSANQDQTQVANVASSLPNVDTSSGIQVATTSVFDPTQQ